MPRNVRQISVNLQAGTAKFFADMESAGAKVRDFGGHTVSSMQASSAAIRTMEGNVTNNVRAVERFLTSVLPLGPALQAAFPLVGALAFGGLVEEVGSRLNRFFKEIQNAGAVTRQAFRDLDEPIRHANDLLAVANVRLQEDIAKLEGRHENTLKLALVEAKEAADRLADSLDGDLAKISELLKKEDVGAFKKLFGMAGTGDLQNLIRDFRIGAQKIEDEGRAKIEAAKTPKDADSARAGMDAALKKAYADLLASLDAMTASAKALQAKHDNPQIINYGPAAGRTLDTAPDQTDNINRIADLRLLIADEARSIPMQSENTKLTAQKEGVEGARANAAEDRPFEDRMKALNAQLDALKAKLTAIGQPESAQVLAKAFGEAQKAIEETSKSMERNRGVLDEDQKAQLRSIETTIAQTEADVEWRTKFTAATTSIGERIRSQDELTAAIGRSYEATRAANVETRLMAELGQHFNDPEWMKSHAPDVSALREGYGREFDAQHGEKPASEVLKLREQIELEKALAGAQMQGAEAVRQATLAVKLRQMALTMSADDFKRAAAAEMELYNAERQNSVEGEVAKVNEKIKATERLTAAVSGGSAAVRQATLANELEAISREGDIAVPGVTGIGQRGLAAVKEAGAGYAKEIADAAAHANRLQSIDDEIEKLREAKVAVGDTLAIEMQLRDLETERLRSLVDESLALRGARDGVRAFFLEMQEDAKSAAEIVYEAMNSALEGSSGLLGKMAFGDKPKKTTWGQEWGKEFKGIGESVVSSTVKSLEEKSLGKLGKLYGIDGKPDGTAGNPLWVKFVDAVGVPSAPADPNPCGAAANAPGSVAAKAAGGLAGFFRKLIGAGANGSSSTSMDMSPISDSDSDVTSSIDFGGFMAEGGMVDPGKAYVVGEHEPELFVPGSRGSIVPSHSQGGGGVTVHYHIDARGAELGAENRIRRALELSHKASVASAVQASHERAKRVPQK